jgi:hypothetical protein
VGADDDVVIGHELEHFDVVAVDVDQAASGIGLGEIDFGNLPIAATQTMIHIAVAASVPWLTALRSAY